MHSRVSPWLLPTGLLALAMVLATIQLHESVLLTLSPRDVNDEIQRLVLVHATLPRLGMALLCGAGLSISGAILQQVVRNPLASPDTMGVSAGARLALAVSALLAPSLLGWGRDLVALFGAAVSTGLVLLIARRRQYSALALILAGLIVSLYCGAAATILLLLKDRYLTSLFIWGSGSLSQQSWEPAISLSVRLGLCLIPLIALLRPLSLLDAGEQTARSLGMAVERVRVLSIGLAVLMAALVTSTVGMIGFIGLAGPVLTRLSGGGKFPAWCLRSAVNGALLLLVTDLLVQLVGGGRAGFLPTGAVTAVVGAPLLLLLLPYVKSMLPPQVVERGSRRSSAPVPGKRGLALAGGLLLFLALTLLVFVGRRPDGAWAMLDVDLLTAVMPWRLPRLLGAAGAGCLLAAAGYMLQRLTSNPMASPEIMGVSAGAVLGAAVALMFGGFASSLGLTMSAAIGSLAALLLVLTISLRAPASPERVLLAGVGLTAIVDALVGAITAAGDPNSVMLMAWMSGSANGLEMSVALGVVVMALLLPLAAVMGTRWLTILPLGATPARSLGVAVPMAQASLLMLVALMTAVATPVIGPLTFVGLMAPHIVGLLGVRHVPSGLFLSAVIGASLMMFADTVARTIAFPLQLPTGILASLLAGPFLLLLISLEGGRHPRLASGRT